MNAYFVLDVHRVLGKGVVGRTWEEKNSISVADAQCRRCERDISNSGKDRLQWAAWVALTHSVLHKDHHFTRRNGQSLRKNCLTAEVVP